MTSNQQEPEFAHLSSEERMFLAADIRDELAEVSDLGFGERNRIAWDTIGPRTTPGLSSEEDER